MITVHNATKIICEITEVNRILVWPGLPPVRASAVAINHPSVHDKQKYDSGDDAGSEAVDGIKKISQSDIVFHGHQRLPLFAICLRRVFKAKPSRDFTVPSGISRIAATSGSVISSRKCR